MSTLTALMFIVAAVCGLGGGALFAFADGDGGRIAGVLVILAGVTSGIWIPMVVGQ